ncbi:MAG: YebC/PmpR family DNA-binding transcriptional regulator [Planctomycetes bacterium]|nr:YebC/PmpR family DNA-binding transcriptional regulator [Planctomycetota bacterium]
MSGHSHWATIKHKKGAADAKRGRLWSKIARMIIVAAKAGGGDPNSNLTLRYAIDKAKGANMPKDTIEKAIKRGTGEIEGASFESIQYEGYGPSGVAIVVEVLTDNRNRTGPEVKRIFEKHNGSLGTPGCVNWMFNKKGVITVATSSIAEDDLMELALGAGAEDMANTGEVYEITCDPSAYEQLKKALEAKAIPLQTAEISMVPQTLVPITTPEVARKIINLMEAIDDHDDVQNAYANFDISAEVMAKVQ